MVNVLTRSLIAGIMVFFLAAALGANGDQSLTLDLSNKDILESVTEADQLWLKLSTDATAQLQKITSDNVGKSLVILFKDVVVVDMTITAAVDTGVVFVAEPSSTLLELIESEIPQKQ